MNDNVKYYFQFGNEKKWRIVNIIIEDGVVNFKIGIKPEDLVILNTTELNKGNMCIIFQTHQTKFLVGAKTETIYTLQNEFMSFLPTLNIKNPGMKFIFDEFRILKFIVEKKSKEYLKNMLLYDEEYLDSILNKFRKEACIDKDDKVTQKGIDRIKDHEKERDILLAINNKEIRPERISTIAEISLENTEEILEDFKRKGIVKETNEMTSYGKKLLQLYTTVF